MQPHLPFRQSHLSSKQPQEPKAGQRCALQAVVRESNPLCRRLPGSQACGLLLLGKCR